MFTWGLEMWTVKNDGTEKSLPVDEFPTVERMKMVVRDERGRFHGATNFRTRVYKNEKNAQEKTGSRVSRGATGLRLVK
jgi:hypothetical protein